MIAVVGAVGTLIAVFADPLGIGEGHIFGWLQITATILGALVTIFGIAMAMEVFPYPARRTRADTTSASPPGASPPSTPTAAVSDPSTPDKTP